MSVKMFIVEAEEVKKFQQCLSDVTIFRTKVRMAFSMINRAWFSQVYYLLLRPVCFTSGS